MKKIADEYFIPLGPVHSFQKIDRGIELSFTSESCRMRWMREDILRVDISKVGRFCDRPSLAVQEDLCLPQADWSVKEDNEQIVLSSDILDVNIQKSPFNLSISRKDGSPVLRPADNRKSMYAHINRQFKVERALGKNDSVFGLGEKTTALNRRGGSFAFWNADILSPDVGGNIDSTLKKDDPALDPTGVTFDPYYISIPFYYHQDAQSGHMAGFFLDNPHEGWIDLTQPSGMSARFEGGQYTEYIFAGPEMKSILEGYTWLTGRTPLPPFWALGHHQCRWHQYSQEQTLELAKNYRKKDLPCDVLWLDIHYMDEYRVFTWNPDLFPDPKALIQDLEKESFRLITIVDPGVKYDPGYSVYDEGLEKDLFCRTMEGDPYYGQVWPGRTAFPDFSLPEARAWWGELNAEHVKSGIVGIWNDMNEPSTGAIPEKDMAFGRGSQPHDSFHNQYATGMAMGTVEGLHQAMPGQRTFVLSRAGSPGIQRYAANWMGDNFSRWEHLEMGIRMAQGLSISGQPFVGADIGGFADDSNSELLERWYQCALFTPFFRNHNCLGARDQYPWAFGEDTEDKIRDAIHLRYRLLPMLYAAFIQATETGEPIQKPLNYVYQYDAECAAVDDQYLYCDHLLIAPVYRPETFSRDVYLPDDSWIDWHSGERHQGPGLLTFEAPADRIPVFVREGAVIPMLSKVPVSTMNVKPEELELHVYCPNHEREVCSLLEEDDGLTEARRNGSYLRTRFTIWRQGQTCRLEAVTEGDGFPEFQRKRFVLILHAAEIKEARLNGDVIESEPDRLVLPNTGVGFHLEMDLLS